MRIQNMPNMLKNCSYVLQREGWFLSIYEHDIVFDSSCKGKTLLCTLTISVMVIMQKMFYIYLFFKLLCHVWIQPSSLYGPSAMCYRHRKTFIKRREECVALNN